MNAPNELVLHQIELEKIYSKNQLMPRIRSEFKNSKEFDFVKYMEHVNIPVDFGIDLLTQMVLHKRASVATLVGCLRHHFKDSQMTADMLLRAAEVDLVDYSPQLQQFIMIYDVSDDVKADLERFQFPLPMVIKPVKVTTNRDTGYMLGRGSILLGGEFHLDDVCLDHINRMNSIKFSINHDTATMVKNQWRNLDKPKEGESKNDFQQRRKAFEKYDRTTKDVMDLLLKHGNEFYLTHRPDKRGRTYCVGYHVNYQGASWNKAVIELADKEIIP